MQFLLTEEEMNERDQEILKLNNNLYDVCIIALNYADKSCREDDNKISCSGCIVNGYCPRFELF